MHTRGALTRRQRIRHATRRGRIEGQQHPLGVYFKIWGLLFVLSVASYMVDYFHFQGY